ncbi:39S ribosomal protein L45, mitochondrial [Dinochytrium kinnereticum]|nr:39S ribosomal protein L45, mitochondrial [Dinochytrium kinnereticum]
MLGSGLGGVRFNQQQARVAARPVSMNIVDRYIPTKFDSFASRFSKAGRKATLLGLKKKLQMVFSVFQLKKNKVKLLGVTKELEGLYIKMNKAFAEGDEASLASLTTQSMRAIINPELKKLRRIGKGQWKLHGTPTSKIVHMATVAAQGDKNSKAGTFVQLTLRITTTQSYAIYSGDRLVGGDPNAHREETEYVVFERQVTDSDSSWQVAGKIVPESKK